MLHWGEKDGTALTSNKKFIALRSSRRFTLYYRYPKGTPPGPAKVTTWHGEWHGLFGILLFVTLMIACFVFARRFWKKSDGLKWAIYSFITGMIVLIFMVLTFNSSAIGLVQIHGVLQKMIIIPGWVWISLLAKRLIKELNEH